MAEEVQRGCGPPRSPRCARARLLLALCDCSGGCVARGACGALPSAQHSRLASAPSAVHCTTLLTPAPLLRKAAFVMGPQVEYHYFKNDTRTYPPTMFNVMRGLRHRGMRVFNVEPNVRHMHLRHVCDQLLLSASAAGVCGLGACSVRDVRARQREVA